MTIWKIEIPCSDEFVLELPKGAEFLAVQAQRDVPQTWWRVDPTALKESRAFFLHGTGHEVNATCAHLGSFQMHTGALVFHLFEKSDS